MTPDRASHFLARAGYARDHGQFFYVTGGELAELVDAIASPPERCPTCGTPTSRGCTRDVDTDNSMGSHWLPPFPSLPLGSYTFNGVPMVADGALAARQMAEGGL